MDAETCYAALVARDRRFDGVFFVAVETTGIYCRPVCPARTPGRPRCRFYARAAEAERDGYRACFRCRPERAPGDASVDARSRLVRRATARIDAGALGEGSLEDLAGALGVTSRHLRRVMEAELGVTPLAWAQTRRLALAKQLLQDTTASMTEVALASGFGSVRRFNAAFQERFGRAPGSLRRESGDPPATSHQAHQTLTLRLDYRPPLEWRLLLDFLGKRAIAGVESIDGDTYVRRVKLGAHEGTVRVREVAKDAPLSAEIAVSLAPVLMPIVASLRRLFDLDAHPAAIVEHLSTDPLLRPLLRARSGLRVPGAFDGYEVAVRALLGQQVSVAAATTLAGRLVAKCGGVLPSAEALAAMSVDEVASIGLPKKRAAALITLADAIARRAVVLEPGVDPEATLAALEALPGIGPWTANYLGMRALSWPDAFPAGDLVLRNKLELPTTRAVEARAERWRPWRAYAAMHLWSS